MLYDYLFLSSNILLLLLPAVFYYLHESSGSLKKAIVQNALDDDKKFHQENSRFHILLRTVFLLLGFVIIIQFFVLFIFANDLAEINKLIKTDILAFIFLYLQSGFLISNSFLILFSFLYFRFKPIERHGFIQQTLKLFAFLLLAQGIVGVFIYSEISFTLVLPELITRFFESNPLSFFRQNYISGALLFILFLLYTFFFRVFSRKRNSANSKKLIAAYAVVFLVIGAFLLNTAMQYFNAFNPGPAKFISFHYSAFFTGFVIIYLMALSFYGIIFSIFINSKKVDFIGSQFAVSYSLKLLRVSFYSTLALFVIAIAPWALHVYYTYF